MLKRKFNCGGKFIIRYEGGKLYFNGKERTSRQDPEDFKNTTSFSCGCKDCEQKEKEEDLAFYKSQSIPKMVEDGIGAMYTDKANEGFKKKDGESVIRRGVRGKRKQVEKDLIKLAEDIEAFKKN